MDLNFSPKDNQFREEAREFIKDNYPSSRAYESPSPVRSGGGYFEEIREWHKILFKKGWVAPSWPKEYGGAEWSVTQRFIWDQETARVGALPMWPFGLAMVGPVIYTFGNEQQKKQYLPAILSGDDWWCQGYSEPGAGSDLASLKTRAVRKGDHYIVNGQKTWTTLAQYSNKIFCLVRTDPDAPKKQQGISFLLVDMKSPGVSVRPIITMDGGHEINEVFLENVEVPVENLIGEENKGWTYAKFLLTHERSNIAAVARSRRAADRLRKIAANISRNGKPLDQDPLIQNTLTQLDLNIAALEFTELRSLAGESSGKGPGPESSILKIRGTLIQQQLADAFVTVAGPHAWFSVDRQTPPPANEIPVPAELTGVAQEYFNLRKTSIYGGSNEIQRNIISKLILGL